MYMESTIIADSHQRSWRPEGNRVTHLKYWREKKDNNQPRSLYLAKLSFKTADETKTFLVIKKQNHEFITTKICSTRNAREGTSNWNERSLDSNSKPHEEMKNTGKSIKASITVLLVSNSFCPPMVSTYKKDDTIMIKNIYINGHTVYKYAVCANNNTKGEREKSSGKTCILLK